MRKLVFLFIIFAAAGLTGLGTTGCSDSKGKVSDTIAADTLASDTAACDSTDDIISDSPMPKAADELFDDFVFNFAANRKLQFNRIAFPLPVYKNGKLEKSIDRGKWKMEHFFMHQGYYTLIFDSKSQMDIVKDTTITNVTVEKIFFDIKTVQQFAFQRNKGSWRLVSINYIPIHQTHNASFLKFYSRFATDSLFQIESMDEEVKFSTPDPDDDFSTMTGWMMPEQWPDFKPGLIPSGTIYNIIYGQKYSETNRKVFVVRGVSNGLEIEMVFRRRNGEWVLTEFSS